MNYDRNSFANVECYHKAQDGEPMFVLLGRDPTMASLVILWADMREAMLNSGQLVDTHEAREHVAAGRAMAHAVLAWQAEQRTPSKQAAYAARRAAVTGAHPRTGV